MGGGRWEIGVKERVGFEQVNVQGVLDGLEDYDRIEGQRYKTRLWINGVGWYIHGPPLTVVSVFLWLLVDELRYLVVCFCRWEVRWSLGE